MKRVILPLLLGLSLTLSACGTMADKPTNSPTPTVTVPASPSPTAPQPAATAVPAPEWGELADTFVQTHPDHPEVVLLQGDFSLPYIDNGAAVGAYKAFNTWYEQLLEDMKNDLKSEIAQAIDDYETATALGDPFMPSTVEQAFKVMYHTETTCAVLRTHYGFSASPYPTLLYMSDRFDMTTGAFLKFNDFFTEPGKAEELIRAEVVRQGAEHADYDQAAIASAFSREYFYPTAEGFVFYYQPGIATSDVSFKPEFLVPYSLLEGLLAR